MTKGSDIEDAAAPAAEPEAAAAAAAAVDPEVAAAAAEKKRLANKRKKDKQKAKKKAEKEAAAAGGGGGGGGGPLTQTDPPTIPVRQLFPDGNFPAGEEQDYKGSLCPENAYRSTSAEKKESVRVAPSRQRSACCRPPDQTPMLGLPVRGMACGSGLRWRRRVMSVLQEKLDFEMLNSMRLASECHRQVRMDAQRYIKPGMRLVDICERIENTNRRLVEENGLQVRPSQSSTPEPRRHRMLCAQRCCCHTLQAGIAFPTGCSINHVAAHYTPNSGDNTVLEYGDVMKIDFGTQVARPTANPAVPE